MRDRVPAKTTVYLRILDGCADKNEVDFKLEEPGVYKNLEDAVADAKEDALETSCQHYVYECKPVRYIRRGKLRVENLEKK